MEPERATMSFEEKRAAFLQAAEREGGEQGVSKEVGFSDNDVTEFLEQYRQFEKESRQVELLAD